MAKRPLEAGSKIENGIGSFDVRGVGVRIVESAGHLPIGLVADAVVTRRVEAGETMSLADVEIPDSLALRAWREVESWVLAQAAVGEPVAGTN